MARVVVGEDCIDIRVSLLERMMLAERSRKLPLSRVRGVNPHPPLLELMVHWADQGSAFPLGNAPYEGHIIPSARNPRNTLSIELTDEPSLFVEVDEAPELVAERISKAIGSTPPPPREGSASAPQSDARLSELARQIEEARAREEQDALEVGDGELDDDAYEPAGREAFIHELSPASADQPGGTQLSTLLGARADQLMQLGGWCLGLGAAATITGAVVVALGTLPGLIAVGAGIVCAAIGATALSVVAHQQS